MRIALTGALFLLLATMSTAQGQSEEDVVHVLVPVDAGARGLGLQADSGSDLGWERIAVPIDGSVDETVANLSRDLGIPVFFDKRYPLLVGQGEPLFGDQWGLENTGQEGGTRDADIDIVGAWSVSTGGGVVVAVIDSGVNPDHPELDGQIWQNPGEANNGADDDNNGFVDDVTGWDFVDGDRDPSPASGNDEAHGTFVAGVIGAEVNGSGISGVAPDVTIMNLRACVDGSCLMFDAIRAIEYAVDNGADIVNLSFGGPDPAGGGPHPIASALEYARVRDVLVVTAAGNTPPGKLRRGDMIVPAELGHSNNVAVAATNRSDQIAAGTFYGDNIDIAAPGVEITSTSISSYGSGSGTSFAAPHVAGVAALLLSSDPGVSHHELSARLKAWADNPPGVAGRVESGRLNAAAVLNNRFVDTRGHTFEGDVDWAADRGVTQGCNPPGNTLFCPNDDVTRGEMAAFIERHLNLPAASHDHFVDDNGSTFENDINRLAEAGITRGCNPPRNDRFCPDDEVTREQMAAFLVRGLALTQDNHPGFGDVSSGNTFRADIARLATAGITIGCNPPQNTRYCPKDAVTRGQMTAFLHRSD